MQTDMHFYGTYVLARAAGIPHKDAHTIAYAAQFVDDSTEQNSSRHDDGGLLYGIATAHHEAQSVLHAKVDQFDGEYKCETQRRIWVPFHFLPGGEGETFEEQLLCVKDSRIANEMLQHHVALAQNRNFGMELLGITAHVYMDTFSHYGFSGVGSDYNNVDGSSFELINVKNPKMKTYIEGKFGEFIQTFGLRPAVSFCIEGSTNKLGHGGVGTYPDRPFLHWEVTFEKNRPGNVRVSDRDNPATYLEGCENMHAYFAQFATKYYTNANPRTWADIKDVVNEVLRFEGNKAERIKQWREAIRDGSIYTPDPDEAEELNYSHEDWEGDKNRFHVAKTSREAANTHVYRFHQAAAIHRYYVLKDLLPSHGITVY